MSEETSNPLREQIQEAMERLMNSLLRMFTDSIVLS